VRGHLRRQGRGWQLVVDVGRDPLDGKRRQLTRTFHGTKREAESELAKFVAQVSNEGAPGSPATTVGGLIESWWEHTLPDLSPNTARGYRSKIDQYLLPALGDIRLRKVSAHQLDAFYRELRARGGKRGRPLAVNTVRGVHRIVHRAFEQAVRWGWLARNPASLASPPRGQPALSEIPEPTQIMAVLALAGQKNRDLADIAHLAVMTGARRSELCGLQWGDLDLESGSGRIVRSIADTPELEIKVPKTMRSKRTVALDPATVEMLRTRKLRAGEVALACGVKLKPTAYVFSDDPDGARPLRPLVLSGRWRRLADAAGVKCRFHDLRHFTASQLIGAGVAVTTVAERLGHASTKMTVDVYGHPVRDADRHAAETLAELLAEGTDGDSRPRKATPSKRTTRRRGLRPERKPASKS
jgi:integrase